jgi:hypothetical protein
MVVLSHKFTILASISALAVVSMLPMGIEAVALPNPTARDNSRGDPFAHQSGSRPSNHRGPNGGTSQTPDVNGEDASSSLGDTASLLPLSGLSKRGLGPQLPSKAQPAEANLSRV